MWVEAVRAEQQKGEVRSSSSNSSAAVYLSPFPHPSLSSPFLPPLLSQERYAEAVKEHEEMIERR